MMGAQSSQNLSGMEESLKPDITQRKRSALPSDIQKRVGVVVRATASLFLEGEEVLRVPAIVDPQGKTVSNFLSVAKANNTAMIRRKNKLAAEAKIEKLRQNSLNERFQQAMTRLRVCADIHTSNFAETAHAYQKVINIAKDFLHVAKTYGKIIITERFIPVEEKTVKPIDIGGKAGGVKYIVGGVLFKVSYVFRFPFSFS
jgi:hypothetical protein